MNDPVLLHLRMAALRADSYQIKLALEQVQGHLSRILGSGYASRCEARLSPA